MPDFPEPVTIPTIDSYRGYPVLKLPLGKRKDGTRHDFSIGYRLALAILEHLEDIKGFAEKVGSTPDNGRLG